MGRKDSEVIFIKRLEALFAVQTVFLLLLCLSFTSMTSLVSRSFFFLAGFQHQGMLSWKEKCKVCQWISNTYQSFSTWVSASQDKKLINREQIDTVSPQRWGTKETATCRAKSKLMFSHREPQSTGVFFVSLHWAVTTIDGAANAICHCHLNTGVLMDSRICCDKCSRLLPLTPPVQTPQGFLKEPQSLHFILGKSNWGSAVKDSLDTVVKNNPAVVSLVVYPFYFIRHCFFLLPLNNQSH